MAFLKDFDLVIREKKRKIEQRRSVDLLQAFLLTFSFHAYFFPTIVVIATSTDTLVLLGILVIKLILKLFNQITEENERLKFIMLRPESLILQH